MYLSVEEPIGLIRLTTMPTADWNPTNRQQSQHGNRPVDKPHAQGIADYLETVPDYIIGAAVLYAHQRDVRFVPLKDQDENGTSQLGILHLGAGVQMDVGDGQHRRDGYRRVIARHSDDSGNTDDGSEVMQRLHASGQPFIVVVDDDLTRRGQDFVDLQRNTKKMADSIGIGMDRRQAVNRVTMDLVHDPDLPVFGRDGDESRVEFLVDSPGRASSKLFSFKTVRLITGYSLGVNERNTRAWEKTANEVMALPGSREKAANFWLAFSGLPDIARVIAGDETVAELRVRTYLASAGVLYSLARACYEAVISGASPEEFFKSVASIDFVRTDKTENILPEDTIFAGNLVDPTTGRISGSRIQVDAAVRRVLEQIGYSKSS
jgi:DGQHR domain-containing protein